MAFLEIKNLKKQFGATRVLHGIDFSMEKGEVVAVIGSSGGGKTTFLRCLNFLEMANEGTIKIEKHKLYRSQGPVLYIESTEFAVPPKQIVATFY
jgi:polar amino acid transport system ATP-binding protein